MYLSFEGQLRHPDCSNIAWSTPKLSLLVCCETLQIREGLCLGMREHGFLDFGWALPFAAIELGRRKWNAIQLWGGIRLFHISFVHYKHRHYLSVIRSTAYFEAQEAKLSKKAQKRRTDAR